MLPMLINFILFQSIWFGCILIGNSFLPIALGLVAFHLYYTKCSKSDVAIITASVFIGLFVDSILMAFGVFEFNHGVVIPFLIPPWLVVIWAGFAMTLNHSLRYFQYKPWLAFIGGSVSGPLSYLAGARLGAIEVPLGLWQTAITFAVIWGPLFLLLTQWAKRMNQPEDQIKKAQANNVKIKEVQNKEVQNKDVEIKEVQVKPPQEQKS